MMFTLLEIARSGWSKYFIVKFDPFYYLIATLVWDVHLILVSGAQSFRETKT